MRQLQWMGMPTRLPRTNTCASISTATAPPSTSSSLPSSPPSPSSLPTLHPSVRRMPVDRALSGIYLPQLPTSNSYPSSLGTPVSRTSRARGCHRPRRAGGAHDHKAAFPPSRRGILFRLGPRDAETRRGRRRIYLLPLLHGVSAGDVVYAPTHCPQRVACRGQVRRAGCAPVPPRQAYVVLSLQGSPVVPAYRNMPRRNSWKICGAFRQQTNRGRRHKIKRRHRATNIMAWMRAF
ncbi:hypothetical protein C8R45DRAFT_529860 [Mycena sanguinolenta]|nr:hypothetical protein C8R45DRAFT_529860 [Mycena sanguinolenta]